MRVEGDSSSATAVPGQGVAPGRPTGPRWAWLATAWLLPLAYLAWRFSSPTPAFQSIERILLLFPVTLFPGVACWIASGERSGRERLGWRLLAASWAARALSLPAMALGFAGAGAPAVHASILISSLCYPLALAGFAALARLSLDRLRLGRLLLDAALTVAAVQALAWYFVLRHTAVRSVGARMPAIYFEYGAELVVLLAGMVAVHRRPGEPAEAGVRLVVLGQFVLTVAGLAGIQGAVARTPFNAAIRFGTLAAAIAITATGALLPARRRAVLLGSTGELVGSLLSDLPSMGALAVATVVLGEVLRGGIGEPTAVVGLALAGAVVAVLLVLRSALNRRALEVELAARTAHEERLQQAQRLEALGLMAASVAHDFNNLLTAIGMATSELGRRAPGDPDVADIVACADRGADLCRHMVGLARKAPAEPRPIDVRSVPEGLARIVRRLLPPGVVLSVEVPPAPVLAVADPAQLEIALLNLAVNARDAMPSGGRMEIVVDVVEAAHPRGHASPGAARIRWVRLAVRDDGIGMDAATQARAREPFFTTKPPGHGTGLGLATVDGIAAANGGHVVIESAPGAGTTVAVMLPAA